MTQSVFESKPNELIIWENDQFSAFLDINPLSIGHTLVIPKKNIGNYIFDLGSDDYIKFMNAAKEVAQLLKSKIECDRVLLWVEGFEVDHVHIHLIPANKDFYILEAKVQKVTKEELLMI